MILDCAWAPFTERPLFATAGRDKQVRVWTSTVDEAGKLQFTQSATIPSDTPVTAVDFLPRLVNGKFVLAVGTENGLLNLHKLTENGVKVGQLPILEG
jgi:elongator complex protein 2